MPDARDEADVIQPLSETPLVLHVIANVVILLAMIAGAALTAWALVSG